MAERGIREYDAKRLLAKALPEFSGGRFKYEARPVLGGPDIDLDNLANEHWWLETEKLVVKPDQLFGKRGKNNLLCVNKTWEEAKDWIQERMNKETTIVQTTGQTTGVLTHFLIEPFVPHEDEYYVAITTHRDKDTIHFSLKGGVDIEELWDTVATLDIHIVSTIDDMDVLGLLPNELGEKKTIIGDFIRVLYKIVVDYHFTYLELNPFTFVGDAVVPLDAVAKLDDYASFQCAEKWGSFKFPSPFGLSRTKEEEYVAQLDSKTGASLKLTILNPKGSVWKLVAGGGASVIYADTVADLGYAEELANYGEYSGDPSTELTYEYTKTILDLMTQERNPDGKPKSLLIGGGIANFTDVAATFTGIIQAIEERVAALKESNVKIYVRRGGPNYKEGLEKMRSMGKRLGLPVDVYGPETHMTKIVSMALQE